MTEEDDIDGLAAEYVLGSLDPAERKAVEERRRTHVALSQAILAWERRLAPLARRIPPVAPPADLFAQVLDRISRTNPSAQIVPFPPRRGWARPLKMGAAMLAACLALVVGWLLLAPDSRPKALTAVLHRAVGGDTADEPGKSKSPPLFQVNVDLQARKLTVQPLTARSRSGRSYQLWVIKGLEKPDSLGIIQQTELTSLPWPATYGPDDFLNATLAVSLEPDGGSPTGAPSGPIIMAGKLTPAGSEPDPRR
jgi:anti-sigma-K factor RskA